MTRELWRRLDVGKVVAVVCVVFFIMITAFGTVASTGNDCYSSTMGNPDQVVTIGSAPYACTNNVHGYRCQKMKPCH